MTSTQPRIETTGKNGGRKAKHTQKEAAKTSVGQKVKRSTVKTHSSNQGLTRKDHKMSKISKVQSAMSSLHKHNIGGALIQIKGSHSHPLTPWLRGTCKTHGHIRAALQWLCLQGTANAAVLISIRLLKYKVITAQVKKRKAPGNSSHQGTE